MRLYLTTLCAWMLPFAGVCLLFAGLAPHSLGTRLNEASTMDEVQAHPACFNPARRVQLRQAYHCYRRQCVRLSQAQSPSALAECRAAVRGPLAATMKSRQIPIRVRSKKLIFRVGFPLRSSNQAVYS